MINRDRMLNVSGILVGSDVLQALVELAEGAGINFTVVNTDDERKVTIALGSEIDEATGALLAINVPHYEIHEGDHYFVEDAASVDNAVTREFLLTAPDTAARIHFFYYVEFTAVTTIELFELCDRTGSVAQTELNNERNSANTADLTVHLGVAGGTTDGVRLQHFMGGIAAGQNARAGGRVRDDEELILRQNVKYLLKITSGTNGNLISTRMHWYEVAA